jgi:predicted permease
VDWKLLLIGAVMTAIGSIVVWQFRKSRFNVEIAAGCGMAFGILLAGTGFLAMLFGLWFGV